MAVDGSADASYAPDRRCLCVLAGSIYNLEDVAAAAGTEPCVPAEHILATAYAHAGEQIVTSLRGDFVLVLYDDERDRGLIARDHMGGRGLVWHAAGPRLTFASEVQPLLALLERTPGPDEAAMAHWLGISGIPVERTLYHGVHRLPAGHLLRLQGGRWTVHRYWLPRYRPPLREPRAELLARLRGAIEQGVARRCVEDRQATGVMLSGGLDSSTVAALATGGERRVRAYSATFPDHPAADESALIDRLAQSLQLGGVRAVVRGGSVLAGALRYLREWGLPPVVPNLFFFDPLLARAAADGIDTLLDGEGGDELFAFAPPLIADRLRRGRLVSARRLVYQIPGRATRASVLGMLRTHGLCAAAPPWAERAQAHWKAPDRLPDWLSSATAGAYVESWDPGAWKRLSGPRWWCYLVEAVTSGMGPALAYDHVRRRAAAVGIEARHPLIDVDVIELVLRLPPELSFDARYSRPLIRESMAGLLPDEVRLRPAKSNFDGPFHDALTGPDLPVIRALLGAPDAEIRAFVDQELIRSRLLDPAPPTDPRLRQRWAAALWRLVTGECWLRQQADAGFTQVALETWPLAAANVELVEY